MLDTKTVLTKAKRLMPDYLSGDEKAIHDMETIAWLTEVPVDFLAAALDIQDENDTKADPKEVLSLKKQLKEAEAIKAAAENELKLIKESSSEDTIKLSEKEAVIKQLNKQVRDLKETVDTLNDDIQIRDNKIVLLEHIRDKKKGAVEGTVLVHGEESDKYQDEIKAIIIDALNEQLKKTGENTRRYDILKDIIDHNQVSDELQKRRDEIKRIFTSDTKNFSDRMVSDLAKAGVTGEKGGKHAKLYLEDDARYMVTLGITPSRTGSNTDTMKDILRIMF